MYLIKRLLNPEIFQGKYKRNNYFEGWYFKIIDKTSSHIFAIIPGVSITKQDKHAFIQFIDANSGFTGYIKYPFSDFQFSEKDFDISINKNKFNRNGLFVEFKDKNFMISGELKFKNIVPFPKNIINPGIMGPYSFVPFMECHHGIVNIHSEIEGYITYNGRKIEFNDGYGYVEKDWGNSFPKSWIWLQSNHFKNNTTSLMFSIASIPWIGREFNGLIAFLKIDEKLYRFATYTGAAIKSLQLQNDILLITIEDSDHILNLKTLLSKGGKLKAPKKGLMDIDITETINSLVEVSLRKRTGEIVYEGVGTNTGLELAGEYTKFYV